MLIFLSVVSGTSSIVAAEKLRTVPDGNKIEIELSPLYTDRTAGISVSRAIGMDWSLTAGATLAIPVRRDKETSEHMDELYPDRLYEGSSQKEALLCMVSLDFWPVQTFSGPVISLGITAPVHSPAGIYTSLGYLCSITKGLKAGIRYRITTSDALSRDSLSISLCYTF